MALAPAAIGADGPAALCAPPPRRIARAAAACKSRPQGAGGFRRCRYAAERGLLGAELEAWRVCMPKATALPATTARPSSTPADCRSARRIAPSSPVAKYVAEAFVALGQYCRKRHSRDRLEDRSGASRRSLPRTPPVISAMRMRSSNSGGFISRARAREGPASRRGWLPRRRRDAGAQAKLGKLLFHGDGTRRVRRRGSP